MVTRLHILGLPHTITRPEYSHCAFTGKILGLARMMQDFGGYEVIHYGNAGAEVAGEHVDVLSAHEVERHLGTHDPGAPGFYGDRIGKESLSRLFNHVLHGKLAERVEPADIICFPFGVGHRPATEGSYADTIARAFLVETGVGYEHTFCSNLVFDSYAWMHWHLGRRYAQSHDHNMNGSDYHWVIQNYADVDAWTPSFEPGKYLAYFGRICSEKGLQVVVEIAKALPDTTIVLCGQGEPEPYLRQAKNITYQPPVWGAARSAFLAGASALLAPTRYVEPFGLVAMEAMLCGTPVLASAYGGFTETVRPHVNGFLCHTLGEWLEAVERAPDLDRRRIRVLAEERYDMREVARQYDKVFRQVSDLGGAGWYTTKPAAERGLEKAWRP